MIISTFSSFKPDELADLLKGFKSLHLIAVKHLKSKPINLFDKEFSEIYYFKTLADNPTIWSFHLSKANELVSINLEE